MARRLAVLASALAALAAAVAPAPAAAVPATNPADALGAIAVDDYGYDYAKGCRKAPQPGTLALKAWLERNAGGSFWGTMRCEKLGASNYSLHAEGRAIDWHLDVHDSAQKREADRLVRLWLAPDKLGNDHALARRMGIQEIIWNCRSWWSGPGGLHPYSACYDSKGRRRKVDDTTAHRNHIHVGLNWLGAKKRASFWSRRASG
ncbi:MAG TPA: hypothetical protein VF520_09775 [Thermoleophilaceae bacterium]|jgi:hypothetical protein